jgi:hypothetical protein
MTLSIEEIMRHNAELMRSFVAPILVYNAGEKIAANWLTGGTAFLAQTDEKRFLVSANHVFAEINSLKANMDIVVLLGGNGCEPMDVSRWPVCDRDESIDICTIEVPEEFDVSSLNKKFFKSEIWPHPRARETDRAFIIGYPAVHRSGTQDTIDIRLCPIDDFVTDSGPRRFTIADEKDERQPFFMSEGFDVPKSFGGMSGSPVFRMIEDSRPEFIGTFIEGGEGLRAPLFAAHADFIKIDGRLDRTRIP